MKSSETRILTTHTGSLPRSDAVVDAMVALNRHRDVDPAAVATAVEASTRDVVRKQVEAGIDVVNDGEQGRESFVTYVQHRLTGFGGESNRPVMRDIVAFPSFLRLKAPEFAAMKVSLMNGPKAIGEVRHAGTGPIADECARAERALDEMGGRYVEPFMTAASPGIVAAAMLNEHYANDHDYVRAVAEALRPEYEYIALRGFVLQIDAPDLAMERHTSCADLTLGEFQRYVERNVAAINGALTGIPPERVRLHVCWGNYEAPHHFDVELEQILPAIYEAHVGAFVLPFANPRHEHEWRVLERLPLPKRALLVAGVIDVTTNYVEHPETVAGRIERVARAVGDPRRVLAGTDCGFDTAAGYGQVASEVAWLKLRALHDGAAIASRRLFG